MIHSPAELVTAVSAYIPHLDVVSMLAGAVGSHALVAGAGRVLAPLPAKVVGMLKDRVKALYAAGKIDAPTLSLLKGVARAVFAWADQEMPASPGPAKMEAVLDRLAAVPYFGWLVRANRDGVREILQTAYAALKAEVKAEAGSPAGQL